MFSELIGTQFIFPGTTLASISIELLSLMRVSHNSVGWYVLCFGLSDPNITTATLSGSTVGFWLVF